MGQRSVPAPFLRKTYELVDDPASEDVISWGENGRTLIVWKTAEFAKDLLPMYFKHNNFSSFVRQLNTYGFRKIAPDKWEFANDNFKRSQKHLLCDIRRRKTTTSPVRKLPAGGSSQSASGNDVGSSSTSSPGTVEIGDLSLENEKLKRHNVMLSSELAHIKKQCNELMAYLTSNLDVAPHGINEILRGGSHWSRGEGVVGNGNGNDDDIDNDDDENDEDCNNVGVNEIKKIEEDGLKLFGVWLKEVDGIESGKKRGRCGYLQLDGKNISNNKNNIFDDGLDRDHKFTRTS